MRQIRAWRRQEPTTHNVQPELRLPAPRTLAWTLLNDDSPSNKAIRKLLEIHPGAASVAGLARIGYQALRERDYDTWQSWQHTVLGSDCNELSRFMRGLEREGDAVENAFLLDYSNGPTEGNVNRLKLIKRTMYGRASFDLLRKKVLYHYA